MTATTFNYDRYILKLANKYGQNKFTEDLQQEGYIGLHLARERYNPSIGEFHQFAQWYIKGYMQKYLTNNSRLVRVPSNVIKDTKNFEDNQSSNISLDQQIDEDKTYGDIYGPVQEEFEIKETNPIIVLLHKHLDKLKPNYQTILRLRYFEEKTYEEIAEELKMSRENVRQLHDKAINKLQEFFGIEQTIQKRKRIKPQKR